MRGEEVIGWRVQVYWEDENEWFEGLVASFSSEKGYFIKYDDGDEHWEVDSEKIKFVTTANKGKNDTVPDRFLSIKAKADFKDSDDILSRVRVKCLDKEEEKAYEDELKDEELDKFRYAENLTFEAEDSDRTQATVKLQQKTREPARIVIRHTPILFHDEERLREMRMELRQEKKSLTNQMQLLTMQLVEQEQVSAALKHELKQFKTSEKLTVARHQGSRAALLKNSPREERSKSGTTVKGRECLLDQQGENRAVTKKFLRLKTLLQEKQLVVQMKQHQRDDIKTKVTRVPRRYLLSLCELKVEIERLSKVKRRLESEVNVLPTGHTDANEAIAVQSIDALQSELTSLEVRIEKYMEQRHHWKLKIDCEKARLAPLETHRVRLEQELCL